MFSVNVNTDAEENMPKMSIPCSHNYYARISIHKLQMQFVNMNKSEPLASPQVAHFGMETHVTG